MMRVVGISILVAALAACASTDKKATTDPVEATTIASTMADIPPEGLPPQKLGPGECGLFLWGMAAPRKFVFFAEGATAEALVLHEGEPRALSITDAEGEVFGQFFTEMQYLSTDGKWSVNLSLTPGEVLEGGQRVDAGRLVTRGADGWETVLPVTGVRACMPG